MRWRYLFKVVGILTLFLGLTMGFPILFGLYYKDHSVIPLLKSMGITIAAGGLLFMLPEVKDGIHQPAGRNGDRGLRMDGRRPVRRASVFPGRGF